MSFMTGKIGFTAVRMPRGFARYETLLESFVANRWEKIKEDEIYCKHLINANAEKIEDDYSIEPHNAGDREAILIDILMQERKPNPVVIKRRYKEELKKQISAMNKNARESKSAPFKPDAAFKKEVLQQVRDEETLKADPVDKRIPLALIPEKKLLLIGTKPGSSFDEAREYATSRFSLESGPPCQIDLVETASTQPPTSFQPFSINGSDDMCATMDQFCTEFVTWLFCQALVTDDIGTAGWVKVMYPIDGRVATLRCDPENESIRKFGIAALRDGAYVQEVSLAIPKDFFGLGRDKTTFKIDQTMFVSEIDPGNDKEARTETPAFAVLRAVEVHEWIRAQIDEFATARRKSQVWTAKAANYRDSLLAKKL